MNRPFVIGVTIVVFAVGLWFALLFGGSPGQKNPTFSSSKSPPQKIEKLSKSQRSISDPISNTYEPWHGGRAMSLDDPRWKIKDARDKNDRAWQGKMPIEFYGKVVDEKNQPVSDVIVEFSWTDLSPEGSTQKEVHSDADGLFSLHGVHGKFLGVMVKKDGYEFSRVQNRYGFEYAGFWEKDFYEPDSSQPVLFHLRKKGETEPLIHWEKEVDVTIRSPVTVQINAEAQMQFTLLTNENPRQKKWEARVILQNGGLIPATDEFIVEAPASGYQSQLDLTLETPKPPTWQLYEGGSFYLKSGQTYGRLDVEMIPGKDWFRVKVWLNPKHGSRNVEYDPAKQINP